MTQNRFNFIKANFSKFEGKEVEFSYYIPSADKYATAKGFIKAIGTGCNEGCFIISERGKQHAIYFERVTILDDPKVTLKKDGEIITTDTVGTWRHVTCYGCNHYDGKVLGHLVWASDKDGLKREILNHIGAMDVTLKADGSVVIESSVGTWKSTDIWKEQGGRRDKSGNKSVHFTWEANLDIEEANLFEYSRDELKAAILNKRQGMIEMDRDWCNESWGK